jgi:hypothetical protein
MCQNKTKEFAEQLRTSIINKYNEWYAITATIMKTLEYPMLATTITKAEWDFIMSPIRKSGLSKLEVSSNFPGKVLYGPKKFQGMGIMYPFYSQEMAIHTTNSRSYILSANFLSAILLSAKASYFQQFFNSY